MPATEHAEPPHGPSGLLRGVAEPLLALTAAFALTLVLTVPFVPTQLQLEVPLRPVPGAEPLPHDELEREVSTLGLAAEPRVLLVDGVSRLVLTGVENRAAAEAAVTGALERSGYQREEFSSSHVIHMEGLLHADRRTLPVVMTIQALIFALGGLLLGRRRVAPAGRGRPMALPTAGLLGAATGVAAVVASAALGFLLERIGLPVEEQAWLLELLEDPAAVARVAVWVVLIMPVSEELFFRLYVFRFIATHAGYPAGLVISSLLFALIHFNQSGLLIYVVIGLCLGWVYHRSGRLVAPIVGHVTLNAIVLGLSVLGASSPG